MAITINTSDATKLLARISRQIPFATSQAINDLAFQVQRAENAAMLTTFKHPRPFTAKSVQANRASKATLSATVFVRPEVAKYLQPYETGGVHVLPGKGLTLLNPKNVTLDQYGQLGKNTLDRLVGRKDVFIGPVTFKSGKTVSGVWQRITPTTRRNRRLGTTAALGWLAKPGLKLLIRFGDALPVTAHLDYHKRAIALVTAKATTAFTAALTKALATAK